MDYDQFRQMTDAQKFTVLAMMQNNTQARITRLVNLFAVLLVGVVCVSVTLAVVLTQR